MGVPFGEAAQRGHAQPGGGRLGLELEGAPIAQRGGDRVAVVGAAEQREHAVTVMREVGVQARPAPVAANIGVGDAVPRIGRRGAVDAQPALGLERSRGMAHVDRDLLCRAAAHAAELAGRQRRGGDRGLRRVAERERRRQHRILPRQPDAGERRRRQVERAPQRGERLARRHRVAAY
jgi:hypothetical protein